MSDRELIELAAKAAGYVFKWENPFGDVGEDEPIIYDDVGFGQYWDPLVDDGDALRLAVKLRLWIGVDAHATYVANDDFEVASTSDSESHGDDAHAATRRAIVRAAAQLGSRYE